MISNLSQLPINKELKRYLYIAIGASLLAIGVVLFLIPNQIVSGGTPGISILLNYFTGIPAGILMFAVNVPLVLISLKFIGKGFAIRTIFSIMVSSSVVDILREYFEVTGWTNEPILASIFGGVAIGLGLGFIIAGNASAGGPSIIARIVADKMGWKQANVIIALDIIIVIIAGIVFASTESALWSLISVYTTGRSMDMLMSGRPSKKVVHISSKNVEIITQYIIDELGIEGTILEGLGFDFQEKRKIIMIVADNSKIRTLREIVKQHDKDGFLVIMEASELLGRGH